MSVLRNSLALLLSVSCLLGAQSANAQARPEERIRILETRVNQLEKTISYMDQRLSNLEYNRPGPYPGPVPPPPPPVSQEIACMLIDSGFSKVFLGKGKVRVDAEAAARQSCGKSVHSSYCNSNVKCSDPRQDGYINGAVCILTDSGFGRTFRGEATTLIEAEYNARKACGGSVHSSYCLNDVRCDTY